MHTQKMRQDYLKFRTDVVDVLGAEKDTFTPLVLALKDKIDPELFKQIQQPAKLLQTNPLLREALANRVEKFTDKIFEPLMELIKKLKKSKPCEDLILYYQKYRLDLLSAAKNEEKVRLLTPFVRMTGDRLGYYTIPQKLARQILKINELELTNKEDLSAIHNVSSLEKQNTRFWFKSNSPDTMDPIEPGREFAAQALDHVLHSDAMPLSSLLIFCDVEKVDLQEGNSLKGPIEFYASGRTLPSFYKENPMIQSYVNKSPTRYQTYPVQVMRHAGTQSLEDLENLQLARFNNFSHKLFTHLVVHQTDAKLDNLREDNGWLFGIDNNEWRTGMAILKAGSGKHFLGFKDPLPLLPQMEERVNSGYAEWFTAQNPRVLVLEWLLNLQDQNRRYQDLNTDGSTTEENNQFIKLPTCLAKSDIEMIVTRIISMQKLLKKNPEATHNNLFATLDPVANRYYQYLKKKHNGNFKKAWDKLKHPDFIEDIEDIDRDEKIGDQTLQELLSRLTDTAESSEQRQTYPIDNCIKDLIADHPLPLLHAAILAGKPVDMIRYLLTRFPDLKGERNAAGKTVLESVEDFEKASQDHQALAQQYRRLITWESDEEDIQFEEEVGLEQLMLEESAPAQAKDSLLSKQVSLKTKHGPREYTLEELCQKITDNALGDTLDLSNILQDQQAPEILRKITQAFQHNKSITVLKIRGVTDLSVAWKPLQGLLRQGLYVQELEFEGMKWSLQMTQQLGQSLNDHFRLRAIGFNLSEQASDAPKLIEAFYQNIPNNRSIEAIDWGIEDKQIQPTLQSLAEKESLPAKLHHAHVSKKKQKHLEELSQSHPLAAEQLGREDSGKAIDYFKQAQTTASHFELYKLYKNQNEWQVALDYLQRAVASDLPAAILEIGTLHLECTIPQDLIHPLVLPLSASEAWDLIARAGFMGHLPAIKKLTDHPEDAAKTFWQQRRSIFGIPSTPASQLFLVATDSQNSLRSLKTKSKNNLSQKNTTDLQNSMTRTESTPPSVSSNLLGAGLAAEKQHKPKRRSWSPNFKRKKGSSKKPDED